MAGGPMEIHKEDLLDNPTNRVPIALCLDVSGSMAGDPINELNGGVMLFFQALKEDRVARLSAEVSMVGFASTAGVILDFQSLERIESPPTLWQ